MSQKLSEISDYLKMKFRTFQYNFQWPDYVWLIDGWMARCAVAIPVLGYLILFNDTVSANLTFENLASEKTSIFGLSSGTRLKFIYLGLLFLASANILYRMTRPYVMKIGLDQFQYVEKALLHFTFSNYLEMHERIRHSGFDPFTRHGKYYDSEWDSFKRSAIGPKADTLREGEANLHQAHWTEAKQKHESLLRSILTETYFSSVIKKRGWLSICIALSLVGYLLILIPSADLFFKVMQVIFFRIV